MKNNQYDLKIGDYILAYNTGVHELLDMYEEDDTTMVKYNQVFTIEGKPVVLNRPAICDIKHCKPAVTIIPEIRKKMAVYVDFIRAVEYKFNNG